jgi:positive regulator of sigma E activity
MDFVYQDNVSNINQLITYIALESLHKMKNKKALLISTTLIMLPLIGFSFIQMIKSFGSDKSILAAVGFLCSLGAWFLVIKAFAPKKEIR